MKDQYLSLFAYSGLTTRQLLDCAARCTAEQYFAHPGYGHGSMHDLFYHLFGSNYAWHLALSTGAAPATRPPITDFPDLAALRDALQRQQDAWQLHLDTLTNQAIAADITLADRRGRLSTLPLWRFFQHLILHNMQHHTELAQLLTAAGYLPGNIDFIFYN